MIVNFSMHGPDLNCIEVLTALQELPPIYKLWEDEEDMGDENGFTLCFDDNNSNENIPFGFGRFLLANKELLQDESVIGKLVSKELRVVASKKDPGFLFKTFACCSFYLESFLYKVAFGATD